MAGTTWETVLADFVAPLKTGAPLVFVLGAGCSISSGGPTTYTAFQQLDSALQRLQGNERQFAPDQSPDEKRTLLEAAFKSFSPGVGYHLLASIARSRPVYVINFNWDKGVEEAALAAGVECRGFEPRQAKWSAVRFLRKKSGLRVIHVHGSLEGDPLARSTETSNFPAGLVEVLDQVWRYPKVCVGVDLGFELDFFNYITSRRTSRKASRPWYFSRGTSIDAHLDKLRRIESLTRMSVTADFDFDLFMMGLAGHLKGYPYQKFSQSRQNLPPSLHDVCLPPNRVLVSLLDAKAVCLAAEPGTGATTLAMLTAYLRYLLAPTAMPPEVVDGVTALKSRLGNGAAKEATAAEHATILVGDDVVSGDAAQDPLLPEVARLLKLRRYDAAFLVAPLESVVRIRSGNDGRTFLDGFDLVMDVRDDEPYSAAVLKAFAVRLGRPEDYLQAIETGLVQTVAQVRAGQARALPAPDQPGVVVELQADRTLRRIALCARLLELSARDKTVGELERLSATSLGAVRPDLLARYVKVYEFERKDWFQVAPGRRAVLDTMLGTDASELRQQLQGRDVALQFELDQWRLFMGIAKGQGENGDQPVADMEPEYFRRMTSALLEEPWGMKALRALLGHKDMDPWGATNLAYSLLAGWERFDKAERGEALDALLQRRDLRGCYAVVEAALFLGTATAARVWPKLLDACWNLFDAEPQGEEMSLVVDAFLWRPPPSDEAGWKALLNDYFVSITPASVHGGGLRFFAAYHPSGLAAFVPDWEALGDSLDWNEAQSKRAAWLVEWHFLHQTFSRTIGFRFGRNDKDLLCRDLHERRATDVDKAQRRLLFDMRRFSSTAGWAFHAACVLGLRNEWLTKDDGVKLMVSLLKASAPDDVGVATGFASYKTGRVVREVVEEFVKEPKRTANTERVVEYGVMLDSLHFSQEQFKFVHDVRELWQVLRLRTPNVEREHLDQDGKLQDFLQEVETSADAVRSSADVDDKTAMRRIAYAAEGLRLGSRTPSLEEAIPAREREVTLGRHVLEILLQMAAADEDTR